MQTVLQTVTDNLYIVVAGVFVFSLAVALIEFVWELASRRMTGSRFKEMLASGSVGVVSALTDGMQQAILVGAAVAAFAWTPLRVPINAWTAIAAVLLVDLIHYWTHRWEHEVRLLWAHHSVHHSSPIYNYSTAARVAFFRVFFDAIYYASLVLLGFHPAVVLGSLALVAVYQIWLHSELVDGRSLAWRVFGKVFCTPSHHRVHHGTQPQYLDKNYGGLLIIWDRIFGSFEPEGERPIYGLTRPIASVNPLTVHFAEYCALARDLRSARTWRQAGRALFAPPGTPIVPPSDVSK